MKADAFPIVVDGSHQVSALLELPSSAWSCIVLAHGAGAGMSHPGMAGLAHGLGERGIGTLRYQFPFMETGSGRPDRPALAQATVRAAVAAAGRLVPSLPLIAGGRSFGGRMTSQAQAQGALAGVRGIVFFGFPLHPANKPSDARADHLSGVNVPMLFLQGTRDSLAAMTILLPVIGRLDGRATLVQLEGADHSFRVPARSGTTAARILDEMLDACAAWTRALLTISG